MFLIPTSTGKRHNYDIQLCSPSKKNIFSRGNIYTIVDCHTYYLRCHLRDKTKSIGHYNYYIDFVKENQFDDSLIFILPDWCWMNDVYNENLLKDRWLENIQCKDILVTITNIECNDYIGIAGRTLFKNNILWYHNFGKNITEDVIPRNVLCTYDSQDHTNLNFKKLESICNKIKELKNEKRN